MTENYDSISKEEFRQDIKLLKKSSQKIKDLLENLLHLGIFQKGDIQYKPENFSISQIVQELFFYLKPLRIIRRFLS